MHLLTFDSGDQEEYAMHNVYNSDCFLKVFFDSSYDLFALV
jgi:hypothetical protein